MTFLVGLKAGASVYKLLRLSLFEKQRGEAPVGFGDLCDATY